MQAVGDLDRTGAVGSRSCVGDPVGQGDGGDCEGGGEEEGPEGDAVDDATHFGWSRKKGHDGKRRER